MFLSDELESIYSKTNDFNIDTCNEMINAICDKCKSNLDALLDTVKPGGSINSQVLCNAIHSINKTFDKFCEKHQPVPEFFINKVKENTYSFIDIINDAVKATIIK